MEAVVMVFLCGVAVKHALPQCLSITLFSRNVPLLPWEKTQSNQGKPLARRIRISARTAIFGSIWQLAVH
jgi:hypothetical protein